MNQIAIQETIQRLINQQVVPGVAWGTITEGSLSEQYTGFLGNTGPFARQKVSSASLYDLASLTKVIGTTSRMLQLIDTNQLAFSTTVGGNPTCLSRTILFDWGASTASERTAS